MPAFSAFKALAAATPEAVGDPVVTIPEHRAMLHDEDTYMLSVTPGPGQSIYVGSKSTIQRVSGDLATVYGGVDISLLLEQDNGINMLGLSNGNLLVVGLPNSDLTAVYFVIFDKDFNVVDETQLDTSETNHNNYAQPGSCDLIELSNGYIGFSALSQGIGGTAYNGPFCMILNESLVVQDAAYMVDDTPTLAHFYSRSNLFTIGSQLYGRLADGTERSWAWCKLNNDFTKTTEGTVYEHRYSTDCAALVSSDDLYFYDTGAGQTDNALRQWDASDCTWIKSIDMTAHITTEGPFHFRHYSTAMLAHNGYIYALIYGAIAGKEIVSASGTNLPYLFKFNEALTTCDVTVFDFSTGGPGADAEVGHMGLCAQNGRVYASISAGIQTGDVQFLVLVNEDNTHVESATIDGVTILSYNFNDTASITSNAESPTDTGTMGSIDCTSDYSTMTIAPVISSTSRVFEGPKDLWIRNRALADELGNLQHLSLAKAPGKDYIWAGRGLATANNYTSMNRVSEDLTGDEEECRFDNTDSVLAGANVLGLANGKLFFWTIPNNVPSDLYLAIMDEDLAIDTETQYTETHGLYDWGSAVQTTAYEDSSGNIYINGVANRTGNDNRPFTLKFNSSLVLQDAVIRSSADVPVDNNFAWCRGSFFEIAGQLYAACTHESSRDWAWCKLNSDLTIGTISDDDYAYTGAGDCPPVVSEDETYFYDIDGTSGILRRWTVSTMAFDKSIDIEAQVTSAKSFHTERCAIHAFNGYIYVLLAGVYAGNEIVSTSGTQIHWLLKYNEALTTCDITVIDYTTSGGVHNDAVPHWNSIIDHRGRIYITVHGPDADDQKYIILVNEDNTTSESATINGNTIHTVNFNDDGNVTADVEPTAGSGNTVGVVDIFSNFSTTTIVKSLDPTQGIIFDGYSDLT